MLCRNLTGFGSARPPRGTHPIGYGGSPIAVVETNVTAGTDVTRRIKQDGGYAGNHLHLDSDIRRDRMVYVAAI